MIRAFRRLLAHARGETPVEIFARPLIMNPNAWQQRYRNRARLARLRASIAAGDRRPSITAELARREKEGC